MNHLIHPDQETIIIGGFGSDTACVQRAAESLSTVLPRSVYGITHSEARSHLDTLAEFADGRNLVPYSGSAAIASRIARQKGVRPASVSFVSPPNVISRFGAIHGFVKSALAQSENATQSGEGAKLQAARFLREVSSHPESYYRLIHESRRFQQLAAALAIRDYGIDKVTLIVPHDDEMFSGYELPLDNECDAEADGVRYVVIHGGHTRFSNDAAGVFIEANQSPFAAVTEQVLGQEIPEKIQNDPTLGGLLSVSLQSLRSHVLRTRAV